MPVLKNARHERFAQALARGKSQEDAYEFAGYSPSRSAASRLATDVNICERLAELTERAADKAVIDKAWVLDRLRLNAETCMALDFVKDPLGNATTAVTHNPAAANKALELLGKELGMFKDQVDLSSSDGSMSPKPTIIEFRAPDVNDEGDG